MSLLDQWWVWMCGAVILAIIEVVIPGYIFLGFAAGAAIMGVIVLFGASLGWATAAFLFAIFSLIGFLTLRRLLGVRHGQVKLWDRDIND